jgi:alpha-glucoside transport system substrate-binding protein
MGGSLLEAFETVLNDFSEQSGYEVQLESVDDVSTLLVTRAEAGNLPDVVQLAKPGQMEEFVNRGEVIALDESIVKDHPQGFVELGTVNDQLHGVFMDASLKSLVWYNPKVFEEKGYSIPETWDELMALTEKMADNGDTPWALGLESGSASGWPGTDWLEEIIIRMHGPEFYDRWVNHEVSWTDSRIKEAWQMFGEIFKNESYVFGGPQTIVSLAWNDAPNYLFGDSPKAHMYKQGTFVQGFIQDNNPNVVAGEDYSVFPVPPINEEHGNPMVGAGDIAFGFTDRPAVRDLLAYLASAEAQRVFAETGQGLAVNKNVSLEAYPDPINARAAEILRESSTFRFDGSDLMPAAVGAGTFWTGMMDYFSGTDLDTVLQNIEKSAQRAYEQE